MSCFLLLCWREDRFPHWQRLPGNCQLRLGLFQKSRQFLAPPSHTPAETPIHMWYFQAHSNSQWSLRTMRALPHLTPASLKAGARFAFKALAKGGQGLQLWTECYAGKGCIPSSTWEDPSLGLVSSHWEKVGQSLQHLYLLQTFSLNQTDHSFATGFGRKQGSSFPPPPPSRTQDKPGLHTPQASL